MFSAYTYAGIIGSGHWVLSILGVLVIEMMSLGMVIPNILIPVSGQAILEYETFMLQK